MQQVFKQHSIVDDLALAPIATMHSLQVVGPTIRRHCFMCFEGPRAGQTSFYVQDVGGALSFWRCISWFVAVRCDTLVS
jgi:hypothetical protein